MDSRFSFGHLSFCNHDLSKPFQEMISLNIRLDLFRVRMIMTSYNNEPSQKTGTANAAAAPHLFGLSRVLHSRNTTFIRSYPFPFYAVIIPLGACGRQ